MIQYHDALNQILSSAEPLPAETIPADAAVGRVTANGINSPEYLPPFANSAMDGFAVRANDTEGAERPREFRVKGMIAAGDVVDESFQTAADETWEIMTGAPLPAGCDRVIKVEETRRTGDVVTWNRAIASGENVRHAGEDFDIGDRISDGRTVVLPEHLMAFAALGIRDISVVRRPRVAVISTGAELAPDGGHGKIRNSSAPYLMAELNALGVSPKFIGTVPDEEDTFLAKVEAELRLGVDVIVSTGAVSMGRFDFVATALKRLGAEILFHKVAIRPGKPLLFAKIGAATFFGVPGNPVATTVGLRFFVEPYLRALKGLPPELPARATLEFTVKKPAGLRCFYKAETKKLTLRRTTRALKGQESFRIAPLLTANSWVVLPEEGGEVVGDTEVDVFPLHSWTDKETI